MQYLSGQEAADKLLRIWHEPGQDGEAEKLCHFLLDHEPANAQVLYLYGTRCVEKGRPGLGSVLLAASLDAEPAFAPAWVNLGIAFRKMGRHDRAHDSLLKAIELSEAGGADEVLIAAINNLATTYNDIGKPEKALQWWDLCLEMNPDYPDAKFNRAMPLLALERFAEGWDAYDCGHLAGGSAAKKRGWRSYVEDGQPDHPYWDGSPGRCVVVWGEQGVGDEVMFASCFPDALRTAKHIVFDCHPRLVNIFRRSFPAMTIFPTRKESGRIGWVWPRGTPEIEARCGIGSLPRFFRRSAADFPRHDGYLVADPALVARYRDPSRLRIGFATQGGTVETGIEKRSIDHAFWGPVFSIPGIEWVSLDYKKDAHLRAEWAAREFGVRIIHDQDMIDDLDKQFACIAGLDLIVTVSQSVCDFAGALGKECWTLTPEPAGWRFGIGREDRLFYPSARLFRQQKAGEWQPVMERAAAELKARYAP